MSELTQNQKYYRANRETERTRVKAWNEANKERLKEYHKEYRLRSKEQKREYRKKMKREDPVRHMRYKNGIDVTGSEWHAMLIAQNGCCAICCAQMIGNSEPALDHDHLTGRHRDLLCQPCNKMLGNAEDDPGILELGITYLKKHAQ